MAKKQPKTELEAEIQAEDQAAIDAENARVAAENTAKIEALKAQEQELEVQLKEVKTQLRAISPSAASKRGPVGVGAFVKEQIALGRTNQEILADIAEKFPANNTTINSVNWYRNAVKNWPDGKRPSKKAAGNTAEAADTEETEYVAEDQAAEETEEA